MVLGKPKSVFAPAPNPTPLQIRSGAFFPPVIAHGADINAAALLQRGYGATAARLTPDQKVGSSNLSALTFPDPLGHVQSRLLFLGWGMPGELAQPPPMCAR